mgnify:CR=1 FL=1
MNAFLLEYLPIAIFLGIASVLGVVFILAASVLAPRAPDPEKLSSYECGFNAFDDARMKFDVRFYLVSILFIIFDLEVAFLFPWAVSFHDIGWVGFWSMMVFLGVLTIGLCFASAFIALHLGFSLALGSFLIGAIIMRAAGCTMSWFNAVRTRAFSENAFS